jgi:hypothetical protein
MIYGVFPLILKTCWERPFVDRQILSLTTDNPFHI